MKRPNHRSKLLVDSNVQVAILKRVAVYWLFCFLFVTIPVVLVFVISNPQSTLTEQITAIWNRYWLMFVMSFLLLPMALRDALRLSNRFIGPLTRWRREINQLAQDENNEFRSTRSSDFWAELAVDTDRLGETLENDQAQPAEARS